MLSYKWTRWISFILSAWMVLFIGNSVAPSLREDAFTLEFLLPWYGPREMLYIILNVGMVMLLAYLSAAFYNIARRQRPDSYFIAFLLNALYSALVYLCIIVPSEYFFIEGRKDLSAVFTASIDGQIIDKFAVMAIVVFGISVALLGLLVEHMFYTMPKMDSGRMATISEDTASAVASHDETARRKQLAMITPD